MPPFVGFKSLTANFTTVPNQYFDHIVGHYHPCVERVVAILIRSTLGWADPDTGERRLEAALALKDFVRPELSECSARRGIAGAIEAGFVIETEPATTRQSARYALRWADAAAQKAAIVRQRKSHGNPRRRGGKVAEPAWKKRWVEEKQEKEGEKKKERYHGETSHNETSHRDTPYLNGEFKENSSSEKKRSFKKGLTSSSGEKQDVLDSLPADQWATLEAKARIKVIAETADPVRQLAKDGKAWTSVKPMMRKLLTESR